MTKILIDSGSFESKGWMAIIIGLTKIIKAHIPDARIVILSHNIQKDEELGKYGFDLYQSPWIWTGPASSPSTVIYYGILAVIDLLSSLALRILQRPGIQIKPLIDDFDVIIHYNPDWYSEDERGTWRTIYPLIRLFILRTIFSDKPYATLPSSMGPFNSKIAHIVSKSVLNRLDLIALRIEESYNAICSLHLSRPQVVLVNDLAFFCDPAPMDRVKEIFHDEGVVRDDKPLFGFCPSKGPISHAFNKSTSLDSRRENYIKSMVHIIDYTIDRFNAHACLIPHHEGDLELYQQIYELTIRKERITYFRNEYFADELKGVIGSCDMFIGSLMHSTIASTSTGVPTIAIAYADKFYGVIGDVMGQEDYIIDIRDKNRKEFLNEIEKKIDVLWLNRDQVRVELAKKAKVAREHALPYGKFIEELVRSKQK